MTRQNHRIARPLPWVLPFVLILTVCGVPHDELPDAADAVPHTISYILDWTSEQASIETDALTLETDLGYRVVISRGYTIAYSVQLVECPNEEEPIDVPGIGRRILKLMGPRLAWAGHSEMAPNPAAIEISQAENILLQAPIDMGQVTLSSGRYCQFHYLIARGQRETLALPDDIDMVGMSVLLEGTYQLADEEPTAFSISTTRAYGLLTDLMPADAQDALEVDLGYNDVIMRVTRNLDRLFDGVDFETMTEEQQASQVLEQIVETAIYQIEITD